MSSTAASASSDDRDVAVATPGAATRPPDCVEKVRNAILLGREAAGSQSDKHGLHTAETTEGVASPWNIAFFNRDVKNVVVLLISLVILLVCLCTDIDHERPKASEGLAVLLITALWWFTEVVPLTITSLLPMVLYPWLGAVSAKTLASKFFTSTSFLFIAGFFIGLAVERWSLHRRVVWSVVSRAGSRVETLVAGFMISVWLLSMWISNTATILCMLPMAQAFLATLPAGHERFQSGFLLSIGYSATIGGMATPVGTPTNGIFMAMFSELWPLEEEFSFATFTLCALPLSLVLLVVVWLGFCFTHVWRHPLEARIPIDRESFVAMKMELGQVKFEEVVVAADLLMLMLLWFTASPVGDFSGWKAHVAEELSSGAVGLALTLPLFFIPCGARLPAPLRRFIGEARCTSDAPDASPQYILDWEAVKQGFKWEILFVFGGGAMIAHGTVESGLADWIAEHLAQWGTNELLLLFLVTCVTCFVTEVVSNMATLSIFGAIISNTAHMKGYNVVVFLLAVCFAASFAFMLPMAGGPNMVVYSTGKISVPFMAAHGLALNIAAIVIGGLYLACVMPAFLTSFDDLPAPGMA